MLGHNLQNKMADAKGFFEATLVQNLSTTNSSKIFKYISSITKSSTLPMTMYSGDTAESFDKGKAQLLNNLLHICYVIIINIANTVYGCNITR